MLTMTKTTGKMTPGLANPETYCDLLQRFPPRPITNAAELAATQAVVDGLLDRAASPRENRVELTADQQDYLNVLGALIYEYEQTLEPLPDIHGVELLKVLMVEHGLRQKDLAPIFKTESIVSDVLHGHRRLTVNHIQKLAAYFHVSPAVFFPA
jgi:HTH-type transcriptional regulator / antitoxin HigA